VSLVKQLREVGKLLGLDCGDNSCLFVDQRSGMRTNGGCWCDIPAAIRTERNARTELDAAVEELCEECSTYSAGSVAYTLAQRVRELLKGEL